MSAIYTAAPAATGVAGAAVGVDVGGDAIHVLAFAELLMLTHLATAAIVIPAVARRLGA